MLGEFTERTFTGRIAALRGSTSMYSLFLVLPWALATKLIGKLRKKPSTQHGYKLKTVVRGLARVLWAIAKEIFFL